MGAGTPSYRSMVRWETRGLLRLARGLCLQEAEIHAKPWECSCLTGLYQNIFQQENPAFSAGEPDFGQHIVFFL